MENALDSPQSVKGGRARALFVLHSDTPCTTSDDQSLSESLQQVYRASNVVLRKIERVARPFDDSHESIYRPAAEERALGVDWQSIYILEIEGPGMRSVHELTHVMQRKAGMGAMAGLWLVPKESADAVNASGKEKAKGREDVGMETNNYDDTSDEDELVYRGPEDYDSDDEEPH